MIALAIDGALVVLALCLILNVYRAVRGPTLFDRVLAFDAMALDFVAIVLLLAVRFAAPAMIDVVLVVALLGFLGTISLAAYLEGTLVD